MSYENLTQKQQELLRWMVILVEGNPDLGEFRAMRDVIGRSSQMVLYSPDGDEYTVDMDSLSNLQKENLIALKQEDSLTFKCSVRSLAFEAVQHNFRKPVFGQKNPQPSISVSVSEKSSANIIVGDHNTQDIRKIVNDPKQFESQVIELTEKIRAEIKSLAFQERLEYEQYLLDLSKQLLSEKPEPSKIKSLISNILFLGDKIIGTVGLAEKVWPYALQLFMLFQNLQK